MGEYDSRVDPKIECKSLYGVTVEGLPVELFASTFELPNNRVIPGIEISWVYKGKRYVPATHKNYDAIWEVHHIQTAVLVKNVAVFQIGTWFCRDSPFGVCFYHDRDDPMHDFCIICGQPDERK